MQYELSDYEGSFVKPMLPNKSRGIPRVDDRRIVYGHLFGLAIRCAAARSAEELRTSYDLRSLDQSPRQPVGCVGQHPAET